MKAITISQPWASLIADGSKWVENRTWETSYRGPIAIHAGKGTQYLDRKELEKYPNGCVIAIAKLTACVKVEEVGRMNEIAHRRKTHVPGTNKYWSEIHRHKYAEGPVCWILEDVQKIEPIEISGKQGLWNFDEPEFQLIQSAKPELQLELF